MSRIQCCKSFEKFFARKSKENLSCVILLRFLFDIRSLSFINPSTLVPAKNTRYPIFSVLDNCNLLLISGYGSLIHLFPKTITWKSSKLYWVVDHLHQPVLLLQFKINYIYPKLSDFCVERYLRGSDYNVIIH